MSLIASPNTTSFNDIDDDELIDYGLERFSAQQADGAGVAEDYYSPDGIIAFIEDVLQVDDIAPYQADILRGFVEHRRIAVRSPHGAGKTATSAWIVLWAMCCIPGDVKVVTTASAWRQLTKFLWPEIRKWANKADFARVGIALRHNRELLTQNIKLPNKEAFPVASDNPELIEGAHASTIIYVFDEAKAIPAGTWDAAEGAFSPGNAYALAISTPGETSGRFYDIHKRRPGYEDWRTRHITLDEAIAAGRINPDWVDQRRKQWGESSAVYQNRVLGEFAEGDSDALIPLSWIEAANERWLECEGQGDGQTLIGCDPARFGEDQTVIARLRGRVLQPLRYTHKEDTMQTVGRVIQAARQDKTTLIMVDVIGIGAGVVDRLREQGYAVRGVNVAESTERTDDSGELTFTNLRSAVWWALREALDPLRDNLLALPPDDILTGDLTAPKWTTTSRGEIKVESKDDLRKRLGRSTDAADALALAWYGIAAPIGEIIVLDW